MRLLLLRLNRCGLLLLNRLLVLFDRLLVLLSRWRLLLRLNRCGLLLLNSSRCLFLRHLSRWGLLLRLLHLRWRLLLNRLDGCGRWWLLRLIRLSCRAIGWQYFRHDGLLWLCSSADRWGVPGGLS